MDTIYSERLEIVPASIEEIAEFVAAYRECAPELSQAYLEMLNGCKENPPDYLWYAPWKIYRRADHTFLGDLCFKGPGEHANPEIGYGILEEYGHQGYATESVAALCKCAFSTGRARTIEAETEPDNIASQKVLYKNGFINTRILGKEGPRFLLHKKG